MSLPQKEPERSTASLKAIPKNFPALYAEGLSINEIAGRAGRSACFVRKRLLKLGVKMRTREEGTRLWRATHEIHLGEYKPKYRVSDFGRLTDPKVKLLTMVITEGHRVHSGVGFTNTQELLHAQFKDMVLAVYGNVYVRRVRIQSIVSSVEIAREVESFAPGKFFADSVFEYILHSAALSKQVLRIVADTEGSMILSARKAPHNYTVEHRVVLASSNPRFTEQLAMMLRFIGIGSSINRIGVQIMKAEDVARFIAEVGFTPGLRVIRKKAGYGIWFGKDKSVISQVCLRISQEQRRTWGKMSDGVFADCKTREETIERLMSIYRQVCSG
jgi:hypothetical protein